MSTFTDEGFLSTSMDEWSKECFSRYSQWFVLCKEFNQYCLQLSQKLKVHENNRQEYIVLALFIRLLSFFEGSVILAERCMVNETKILLRGLMEALFALRAIANDKTVAEEYYHSHFLEKLKNLRLIKRSGSHRFYHGLDLDKRIVELEEIVKQKGIKRFTVESLAQKAELYEFYATAYLVFSWTVHSNVIDIAQYINGKSDDYIEGIFWQPQLEGIDKLLLTAMECAVIGLRSVNELFGLGATEEIEEYSQKYQTLAKKTVTEQSN
ncbi:DUF5677 domain-containing protein [Chloroflexota bacterium]